MLNTNSLVQHLIRLLRASQSIHTEGMSDEADTDFISEQLSNITEANTALFSEHSDPIHFITSVPTSTGEQIEIEVTIRPKQLKLNPKQ